MLNHNFFKYFLLVYCYFCCYVTSTEISIESETVPQTVTLDIIIQIAQDDYSLIKPSDEYLQYLLQQKTILKGLIGQIEEKYPGSRYSIIHHITMPYNDTCSRLRPFHSYYDNHTDIDSLPVLEQVPIETKNSSLHFSSVLLTIVKALNSVVVNWRYQLDGETRVVKIILVITNYWDNWMNIDTTECESPVPSAMKQRLRANHVHIIGLATEDVLCQWKNLFIDLGYSQYLREFDLGLLETDVLELIEEIVEMDKTIEFDKEIVTNPTSLPIFHEHVTSKGTVIHSYHMVFILLTLMTFYLF